MDRPLFHGGCLCGDVRFEIVGPLPPGAYCHCTQCRKSSGSVAAAWISVPREHFRFVRGEPAVFRSSPRAERRFCPRCGSQLTFYTESAPEDVDVALGTLDDAANQSVDRHTFAGDRLPWLHLDEHLPHYEGWTTVGHGDARSRKG